MFGYLASKKKPPSKEEGQHFINDIGSVLFRRNARAKRLTISIRSSNDIRVTIPGTLPFRAAHDFVVSKKAWIVEKQKKFKDQPNGILTNESNYHTRSHQLKFYPQSRANIFVSLAQDEIKVYYPNEADITSQSIQDAARKGIELALRHEAHQVLPIRVRELAAKHGFKYNNLTIKRTTSRWGSCSSKNNINLSIFLMKLPDELVDYVILHELTHTLHRNHGSGFWQYLNRVTGNAKGLAARVKKYNTGV